MSEHVTLKNIMQGLSPEELEQANQHLRECAVCRASLDEEECTVVSPKVYAFIREGLEHEGYLQPGEEPTIAHIHLGLAKIRLARSGRPLGDDELY